MSAAHTRTWQELEREDAERRAWLDRQIALDKAGSRRTRECMDCDRPLANNCSTWRCEPCQAAERKRLRNVSMAKYRLTERAKKMAEGQKKRRLERERAKRLGEAQAAQDSHRLAIIEGLKSRRIETATRKLRERGIIL